MTPEVQCQLPHTAGGELTTHCFLTSVKTPHCLFSAINLSATKKGVCARARYTLSTHFWITKASNETLLLLQVASLSNSFKHLPVNTCTLTLACYTIFPTSVVVFVLAVLVIVAVVISNLQTCSEQMPILSRQVALAT